MPTINESELPHEEVYTCFNCHEYEGAIFLCGEGFLCERCFAEAADIPEEFAFDEEAVNSDEIRSRARIGLKQDHA